MTTIPASQIRTGQTIAVADQPSTHPLYLEAGAAPNVPLFIWSLRRDGSRSVEVTYSTPGSTSTDSRWFQDEHPVILLSADESADESDTAAERTLRAPAVTIPRNAEDARRLRAIVRSVTRDYGLADMRQEFLTALDRLALFLPGGMADTQGRELAESKDLCPAYEGIVCDVLGWSPRERFAHVHSTRLFERAVEAYESEHAGEPAHQVLIGFADRYAPGGTVNQAICDHMSANLERHKRPAANELLAALGLEGLETEREYEVEVEVFRTRVIRERATVTVTVEASDEDEAADLARDEADPYEVCDWDYDEYDSDTQDYETGMAVHIAEA